jgi:RNA recognition motif-containing protein
VVNQVVMDRDDPSRSRGFAFVRYSSVDDAKKAAMQMDGQVIPT